ncbi:hypothetical protein [Stenotrophomonas maltophilia]|uniref:hypothetical protein n=1 Tax=Stenotrophomonas maltophilia TaxID=40324 RepID=UPI001E5B293D|nr:hypothetical protein [Stenotrophomonas maltophilia]
MELNHLRVLVLNLRLQHWVSPCQSFLALRSGSILQRGDSMDGRNLLYAGISLVTSIVMYVVIPEPLWDMYQFDTERLFPWLYMVGLIFLGLLLRPYEKGGAWKCAVWGGGVGAAAGVFAQAIVILVERERFSSFNSDFIWQVLVSFVIMSAILMTPVWGAMSSVASFLLLNRSVGANPAE